MALVSLMVPATPGRRFQQEQFEFEHANAHRTLFGAMASDQYGLSRYSALPYKLDPSYRFQGGWKFDHGQAHHDFSETLPGNIIFWFYGFIVEESQSEYLTLGSGSQYIDPDLSSPEQLNWWVWQNHTDHLIAETVVPIDREFIFPFW